MRATIIRKTLLLLVASCFIPVFLSPAAAVEIRDRETLIALIREASEAATPADIHRILRRYAEIPASEWVPTTDGVHGVLWFDNSMPRARIVIPGINADDCFRHVLADQYLLEAINVGGKIDLELEIRAGLPAVIRGRLRLHDATLRWTMGNFALAGVNGSIPFQRSIGTANTSIPPAPVSQVENVRIDTMIWSNRPIAVDFAASASYTDRILRFDQIRLKMMGGTGVGSVIFDHRGWQWRAASMVKFEDVDLMQLPEILPSIPALARVTMATIRGQIGLVYKAPDQMNLTGKIESIAPGVIELSPMMREVAREFIDSRVIRFQRLSIDLGRDRSGELEAQIHLYRRTGQSIFSFFRGEPFAPTMLTIRFPIVPFVKQLSQQ